MEFNDNDIVFSRITSYEPTNICKTYELAEDGGPQKTSGGNILSGKVEIITVQNISEMKSIIMDLGNNQALIYGRPRYSEATITTAKNLEKIKKRLKKDNVIARTKESFGFYTGNSLFPIDYDPGRSREPLSKDELLEKLYSVCSALRSTPHVIFDTSSGNIYNGDEQLIGPKGIRILFVVKNGSDIPRAGEALFKRLWLADEGFIDISKSGSLLVRTIVDAAVWSPERLDFAAGAYCKPPLEQRRPDPQIIAADGNPLDTQKFLPSLNLKKDAQVEQLIADAKNRARPEAERIRDNYIEERVIEVLKTIPAKKRKEAEAKIRKTYAAATRNKILGPDFLLMQANGKMIAIKKLLADPDRYHNTCYFEPVERDYSDNPKIARVNLKATRPYIFSFAHGGIRYFIERTRPKIKLEDGNRFSIVDQSIKFFAEIGRHYQRGGELVTTGPGAKIYSRNHEDILMDLDCYISAEKWIKQDKAYRPRDWPAKYGKGILAAKESWSVLPELIGIATAPLLDPVNGRIIETDGFDKQTGILMELNDLRKWPGVPDKPTIEELEAAVKTIWKAFWNFPFDGPVSRGVFLSALLTMCIRPLLPTAPGICATAPTAGSGKTILAKCLCEIAAVTPALMPDSGDNTEIRKALLSLLRENRRVVVLDNITGAIDSPALCALLTAEVYSDRVLGLSQTLSLPTRFLLMLTGNNVVLKDDLCRRVLTARIDTETEEPWKRSFDLDPVAHCRDNRLSIVAAALTIIRAGMQSGPDMPDRTASFELWSDTVRRAVCRVRDVIDIPDEAIIQIERKEDEPFFADPVESIDVAYGLNPETQKLSALCATWWSKWQDEAKKVSKVISIGSQRSASTKDGYSYPELYAALDEIAGERGVINPRRLGRWIERNRGKLVSFKIDKTDKKTVRFINDSVSGGCINWALQSV